MMTNTQKNPSVSDAIASLGGDSAVAKLAKTTAWAVAKWRTSLPPKRVLWLSQQTNYQFTPHMLAPDIYPNANDGIPREAPALIES